MDRIVIQGGTRLHGEVKVSGSKNAALPQMAACLLAPGKSTLRNIPHLRDVSTMIDVLRELGAHVSREDDRLTIDATSFASTVADCVDIDFRTQITICVSHLGVTQVRHRGK